MSLFPEFNTHNRLFTYIITHDTGFAPNVDGGFLTLATCKPKIRSVIKENDMVVGFTPKAEGNFIIFIAYADEVITWAEYIERCTSNYKGIYGVKIPKTKQDLGDCIWKTALEPHDPYPNFAEHECGNFQDDVVNGKNVLISNRFVYLGTESKYNKIYLDGIIKNIIPYYGHQSNSNTPYKTGFLNYVNGKLEEIGIKDFGVYGHPSDTKKVCGGC